MYEHLRKMSKYEPWNFFSKHTWILEVKTNSESSTNMCLSWEWRGEGAGLKLQTVAREGGEDEMKIELLKQYELKPQFPAQRC